MASSLAHFSFEHHATAMVQLIRAITPALDNILVHGGLSQDTRLLLRGQLTVLELVMVEASEAAIELLSLSCLRCFSYLP